MLKTRIITASILLPLVLVVILYCPTVLVSGFSAIIFILAALEWTKLIGLEKNELRYANIVVMISACIAYKYFNLPVLALCFVALLWWVVSLAAIIMYPKGISFWSNNWVGFCVGCILFVPAWLSIDWLHGTYNMGPVWVIFMCFLVWSADVGAYFIGKKWGKKKLLVAVSPGKTWLGVLGAILFAFIVVVIFKIFWLGSQKFIVLCALGLIAVVFSIVGDLVESLFKRIRGYKDSGNLLPGHGGVLDRIDGLLAAIPTFIVGLNVCSYSAVIPAKAGIQWFYRVFF